MNHKPESAPALWVQDLHHRYPARGRKKQQYGAPVPTVPCTPDGGPGARFTLREMNLQCQAGTITGILGPNGSGKSTLLRIMGGLVPPTGGRVLVNGRVLSTIKARELATIIGFFPQNTTTNLPLTVGQLVLLGREPLRERKTGWFDTPGDHRATVEAMERTGVTHLAHRPLPTLSGGEMQRAWLAKTLAQNPQILLLDEPVNHLDMGSQIEILDLVVHTARESALTVVMVLHDLNLAAQYCDQVVLLNNGELAARGTPKQVLTRPVLEKLYRVRLAKDRDTGEGDPVTRFIPVSRLLNQQ